MADLLATGGRIPKEREAEVEEKFKDFYEDVFLEAANYGEVS